MVTLDGVLLAVYQPGPIGRGGDFNRFELPAVRISAGTHTLAFQSQQNGPDSDTLIDDIRFTAVEVGALAEGASLALAGSGAVFDPGPGAVTLDSLAGVAGSVVDLTDTNLIVAGSEHAATFAGSISGTGSLTNTGTLRLVGEAALDFTGAFTNNGIVLDRSQVRVNSFAKSEASFSLHITGFSGHNYQLQRADDLSGPWQSIGSAQPGAGTELLFTDPEGTAASRRFYRVSVVP